MRRTIDLTLSVTGLFALISAAGCSAEPEGGGGPVTMFGQAGTTGLTGEGQGGANFNAGMGGAASVTAGAGGAAALPPAGPTGGYFAAGTWKGYAWSAKGVAATTVTPETFGDVATGDPFCVQGTVAADPDYQGFAMLGFNINQADVPEVEGTEPTIATATPTADGIAITSSQQGTFELRIQIQGPADAQGLPQGTWCAAVEAVAPRDAQGRTFVPYSAFNTECYAAVRDPALDYQNQAIAAVTFQVPGDDVDPTPYQFCVAGFGEGATAADAPTEISVPVSGTLGGRTGERLARVKVQHEGKSYIVSNNAWGTASSDFSQVIAYEGTRTAFDILTQTANGGNQPVSFPSIYIGANGFQGNGRFTTRLNDGLPIQVSAINSLPTTFNHNATGGDYNATYDVWFVTAPPVGEYDGTRSINGAFLMVWTYRPGNRNPIQSGPPTQVQVDGRAWNLYVGPRGNESQFPNTPVISYVNEGPALTNYTFDLNTFIDDAVARNTGLTNNMYLTDVFAGFEIWSGGQGLAIDEFSAVVNP